jgi:hypothetical protein
MEADTRRLQPASIGMFSIEQGAERYTLGGAVRPPPFSAWRCNVTALSQRYNLYFVATVDSVAVFVPEFPYQKLGNKPSLVITPTLANDNASGYIDEEVPHAVNHLIVGDLGIEEILLVARDSGNIDAYHTRAIRDAIEKEPYRFSKEAHADFVGLRAFFSQWVHKSAWGLAIHKEARMIAVSANRDSRLDAEDPYAKVTVFAFALSEAQDLEEADENDEDEDSSEVNSEWRTWKPDSLSCNERPLPRNQNYKIVLDEGHANNIPSISFSNTADDPFGTWLFSTDIEGDVIAWNIWKKEIVNCWTTTTNAPDGMPVRVGWGVRRETTLLRGVARRIDGGETDRGWIVAALDPRAFAVANNMAEFCGVTPSLTKPQQKSFGLTEIAASSVPGNSQRHPQHRRLQPDFEADLGNEATDNGAGEDLLEDDFSSDQETSIAAVEIREQPLRGADSGEISESSLAVATGTGAVDAADDEDTSGDQDLSQFSQGTGSSISLSSLNRPFPVNAGRLSKRIVRSAELDEQDLQDYGLGFMVGELPLDPRSREARSEALAGFPLLHCSVSHVRLVNAPFAGRAHWYCGDLLTQLVPENLVSRPPYSLDRMNMIQQIPELGLVIIASQSGRCAVCSTMRKTREGPLGLRVDWVLPTTKQETAGLRPPHALLGIAAGPIQGFMEEDGENDEEDTVFRDGTINGTSTSFDTDVILSESSQDESGASSDERDAKRLKTSGPPLIPPGRYSCREQRTWSKPEKVEAWRGVNYSRRFRLMLTYWDWTVLTYEIAREEPNIGIESTRKNYRNRSAASAGYYSVQADFHAEEGAEVRPEA